VTALAIAALLLLAYTYVGYPIAIGVLARLARRRPHPAAGDGERPRVTICMPAYNGADYLPAKMRSLFAQDYPADRLEIPRVLDGSTDDSERIVRELALRRGGGTAAGDRRAGAQGEADALNVMGAAATGDLLLLNDVRQPLSLNATAALAAAMADAGVGCATGNLVLAGGRAAASTGVTRTGSAARSRASAAWWGCRDRSR
jgi:cellulose synthase/poly-beta-1,6-N-acetylglucosamine synthase-like glycosyltransferase